MLDRPLIKNEFTAKYVEIIVMLDEEIGICEVSKNTLPFRVLKWLYILFIKLLFFEQELFKEQCTRQEKYGHMEIDAFFPPVAGGLLYMSTLAARVTKPVSCFRNIQHP